MKRMPNTPHPFSEEPDYEKEAQENRKYINELLDEITWLKKRIWTLEREVKRLKNKIPFHDNNYTPDVPL